MTQEDGKRDDSNSDNPPEVEAELVNETASSSDAFASDDAATASESDHEADDALEENAGDEQRKSTLTPGVILFLAFAVVALAAFGFWRLQSTPESKGASENSADSQTPVSAARPEASVDEQADNARPGSEAPASPVGENSAEARTEIAAAEDKIRNTDADLKPSAARGSQADDNSFLPPVPEAGAEKLSNSVEDGANEAMRHSQEMENAEASVAFGEDEVSEVTQGPSGFELEPADGDIATPPEDMAGPQAGEDSMEAASTHESDEQSIAEPDALVEQAATIESADSTIDVNGELASLRAAHDEEVARLEDSLAEMRQRNDDQAAEITALRDELAQAIANRDQTVNAAMEETRSLRASLEKLRNERTKTSARQMDAAFALAALARAIDQGAPYQEELAVIAELEPGAQAALGAYAETGVPTDAYLRERFDVAARAALAAAARKEATGWWAGLKARAQSLISVRPAHPVDGDAPGAVLSRAEHALEEGDVAFALLQLEDLPIEAQSAMADWISGARARAEAEAALSLLQSRLAGSVE